MKTLRVILISAFWGGILSAHPLDNTSADTLIVDSVANRPADSLRTDASAAAWVTDTSVSVAITDTSDITEKTDVSSRMAVTDTLPDPHQVATDAAEQKKKKSKLIKRTFDSRQQVSLGIGMMIFIALIMTTAQSWNPKN